MSVLPSDIVVYGSANMPESDSAMTGGAIDFTRRVAFYDIAPAGNVDVISSSASDTATKITYYGRDPTGVIQSQTLTLNGQTWVTGTQPLERLLYAALEWDYAGPSDLQRRSSDRAGEIRHCTQQRADHCRGFYVLWIFYG